MSTHPLENLVYESNRLIYYPGKLLFRVCAQLVENDLPGLKRYVGNNNFPEFLNINSNFFSNISRESAVNWFIRLQQFVNREYDKFCLQIKEATILAIACFETLDKPKRDAIGLMIMLSMSHVQQSRSKQSCIDFALRFANSVRSLDLTNINAEKSFLYSEMRGFSLVNVSGALENLCMHLETFTSFTIRPWNVALQYSTFLITDVFKPIYKEWQDLVVDIFGKQPEKPMLSSLQKTIAQNIADAGQFYQEQSEQFVNQDMQMTIDAIIALQTDMPFNLNELNDMFKRRTGYDLVLYMSLLSVEAAEETRVEIIEKRQLAEIQQDRNDFQAEYDLYANALKSFEDSEMQLQTAINRKKYDLFKSAAKMHFKRNKQNWESEMDIFDLNIANQKRQQLLKILEKLFIANDTLQHIQDELDGILKGGKRTLRRIRQDIEKAEFYSHLAENALKSALLENRIKTDDPTNLQIIALIMKKNVKLSELEETIARQFPKSNAAAFQSAAAYFRYAIDAEDNLSYLRQEEDAHLRKKNNWLILLTVVFFALFGALVYYGLPLAINMVEDSLIGFLNSASTASTPIVNTTNVTNATADVKNAFVDMVGDVDNFVDKAVSVPKAVLGYIKSKLYVGIQGTRVERFMQDAGVVGMDWDRLRLSNLSSAFYNYEFTSAFVILGYWMLIFKTARTILPFWHGLAVSSARVVIEGAFEDDMLNSISAEIAVVQANFGVMSGQFIDLGTSYIVSVMDRGRSAISLVQSVGQMAMLGKAGIIPATMLAINANGRLPENVQLHLQNFSRKDVPKLWYEAYASETLKIEKPSVQMLENASKVAPNKPLLLLEDTDFPDVDLSVEEDAE